VNKHYPELGFDLRGECYGWMMIWHVYTAMGKDFFAEIHKIKLAIQAGKKLHEEQLALLRNIHHAQNNQVDSIRIEFEGFVHQVDRGRMDTFAIVHDKHYASNMEIVAKNAVQKALANPGELIKLTPGTPTSSHAIGMMALEQHGKVVIKYFDSNGSEATFIDPMAAAMSAANLLCFGYAQHFKRYKLGSNFHNFSITIFKSQRLQQQCSPLQSSDIVIELYQPSVGLSSFNLIRRVGF